MTRKIPAGPPVYRPQPTPKVLQTKRPAQQQPASRAHGAPAPHRVGRPQPPKVLQPKGLPPVPQAIHRAAVKPVNHRATLPQPVAKTSHAKMSVSQLKTTRIITPPARVPAAPAPWPHKTVQCFSSPIIQATKYYPNLHPGAVESIDRSNIFRLDSFADQYRLRRVGSHGVNVPNQQYNFVRTRDGEMLLHSRYRHPSIAEGQQVLYAGEIFFNNGKLQWWSNGSGHYQPDVEDAEQASLPMDYFFSYQQIIKGEHTQQKSTAKG